MMLKLSIFAQFRFPSPKGFLHGLTPCFVALLWFSTLNITLGAQLHNFSSIAKGDAFL